jgi:hypothetical protein
MENTSSIDLVGIERLEYLNANSTPIQNSTAGIVIVLNIVFFIYYYRYIRCLRFQVYRKFT